MDGIAANSEYQECQVEKAKEMYASLVSRNPEIRVPCTYITQEQSIRLVWDHDGSRYTEIEVLKDGTVYWYWRNRSTRESAANSIPVIDLPEEFLAKI